MLLIQSCGLGPEAPADIAASGRQRLTSCKLQPSDVIRNTQLKVPDTGCRFFVDINDFDLECRLCQDPTLRETLPACIGSSANKDGRERRGDGFVFPPYLVMDRGTPLAEWKQTPRQVLAVVNMLQEVPPSPDTKRDLFLRLLRRCYPLLGRCCRSCRKSPLPVCRVFA